MKRSKFSLSHYRLLSCDMGKLVPCGLVEVLPGDTLQQATSMLVRLSPLLAPMMHPVHVRVHHWFVPHRIVWEDWEDFITGGPDNDDPVAFPTIDIGTPALKSLADYMGLNTQQAVGSISALPFRAYAMIWNEWYRDQDLQTELTVDLTSGADTTTNTAIQNVAWEKDYFTSARPWPQKGPDITVPISGTPLVRNQSNAANVKANINGTVRDINVTGTTGLLFGAGYTDPAVNQVNRLQLDVPLDGFAEISINDLRESFALQRFAEARARYGSRYTEYLRYLGVRSSDARLQRPEYLGGGRQTLQVSEVLQTAPTTDGDDTVGVGNLKGHGIGAMRSNRYRRFFEEHGYVISLLSVKPVTMYTQGTPKTWLRTQKEDFFQKELQHIGQQEIDAREIYSSASGTFGYQDRYDEYRRAESGVSGDFRTSLNYWHMARQFATTPTLNSDFITSTPTKRNFAVESEDVMWIMCNHSIQARRLLTKSGTPGMFR